ncbi:MAG: UDP-N-acetylglucosamine--N-acetylmuramyl-(pentapeptide) pyrophosphoryl-undecaprenol N-acetylglucosamine transferase [Candidatus Liptonbacteria bacterium]|nr:UDP-N-acetylglucosamine--N-acetylmuramyl-(pentapeptide) pyrophosphoryl-undecaprenol N-acetylglucosamine transferase [Candidatus Liptonbacteria bacterium]
MKKLRIAFTGGGSGGHIYPLVAVAEELERISIERKSYMEIKYFGPAGEFKSVLEDAGIKVSSVASGKVRRYFSLMNFIDIPKSLLGLFQAFFKMYWFMPNVLFSKGGTGAFMIVLAARFYRIPVIIHESDAQPGLNNLLSARFAKRIAVSFERALNYFDPSKTALVGVPVRRQLLENLPSKEFAKEELGFDAEKPLVLFLGGSRGARRLNDTIMLDLKNLMNETQILHQTGQGNISEVENMSKAALSDAKLEYVAKSRYLPVPYLDQNGLKLALSAADLVVARSGSMIFEIAAFSKPAILVPLSESANDHQRIDAHEFAKTGAAEVIEESNMLPGIFLRQITETLKNPELLRKMSAASGNFFKPRASEILAEEILKFSK